LEVYVLNLFVCIPTGLVPSNSRHNDAVALSSWISSNVLLDEP
jgi:hypothetical protein